MERWLIFVAIAAAALLSLWFMIVDPKIGLPPVSVPQPTEPSEDVSAPPLPAPSPSGLAVSVEIDFGDAPEYDEANPETMTVYGKDDLQPGFPTVINSEDDEWYVSHDDPFVEIFLGRDLSLELEPQTVDRDDDDGLVTRDLAPCHTQKFEITVTIPEVYTPGTPLYFNALFDWDQDGEWEGDTSICGFTVEEWAVQDLRLDESPYFLSAPGTYTLEIPVTTAQIANVWTRLTVTTVPVPRLSSTREWHGQGQFTYGESEDWIFRVADVPCVPVSAGIPLPPGAVPCPTVQEQAENGPPDAVDDAATTDEGNPVTIPVLSNDSDPDGDPIEITGNTNPSNGSVNCTGSECEYTPDPNFCGTDSFEYTISDGNGGTDTATVTIEVNCVNGPPDAVDDSETTDEDTPVTIDVLDNDSDPDGDPLDIIGNTSPSNGSVNCTGLSCEYTPNADFCGTDSFEYTISDGNGGEDTATVTVTVNCVNDPPDAVDDSETTDEDTPVTIQVLTNDSDPENDPLTITGNTSPSNGSVSCSGSNCEYTPNDNFCGTDSFEYTISDGNGGSDTATVTVTVNCVNDPPDAVDDNATTDEDTPVTIQILTNDSDPENDPLTITGNTSPSNGSVSCSGSNCSYTPNTNYCGTDSFDYTISDGNGGSDTATVNITVNCVNDPPDAVDDFETTQEDTPVTVQVLTNDSDPENDPLTITSNTNPSNGTVSCSASNCTYTPNSGYTGTDTFQYTISDGNGGSDTATVTITIEEDPSGWDKSSMIATGSSSSCTGSGTGSVSGTVQNVGEDMEGSTTWELWYAPNGNAKNGTMIASGVIPALAANQSFTMTVDGLTNDGNYVFKAVQRPEHPGQGVLWTDQVGLTASSCT